MRDKVLYETRDRTGKIMLNDPENGNAIGPDTLEQLISAFRRSADNKDACVIYTAIGDNFTFGADLRSGYNMMTNPDKSAATRYLWGFQELTAAMTEHEGIIIAGFQGYVVGGGFEHTLVCDLRIAAEDTVILMPELDAGLFFSNGATSLLARIVGLGRANQIMLLGDEIKAPEALSLGLVNHVCTREDLGGQLDHFARRILAKDPTALKLYKQLTLQALGMPLDSVLYNEGRAMVASGSSQGAQKRIKAFLERG